MPLFIHVYGAEELAAKAASPMVQAALDHVIDQAGTELATPRGSGLGVQRNTLALQVGSGMAAVTTSLIWPRTTGLAWAAHAAADLESMDLSTPFDEELEQAWED